MWFSCKNPRWSKQPEVTQGCYRTSSLQQTTSMKLPSGVRRRWFQWMTFLHHAKFQLEMFPKCVLFWWCLQRSRTNCSYGVAINPEMDGRWCNKESPFRILKFSFSRKQKKASGKNQNIHRFCANSCLGIVPSEIHVKSRCSDLRNWNRNMTTTPCSL